MTRIRAAAVALAAVAAVSVLAACGVPLQSEAEPLPANVLPAPLPSFPTPSEPSPTASAEASIAASPTEVVSRLRLWFVQEDGLASAESDLPTDAPAEVILQSLAIGPSAIQIAEGMRTVARDPLTGMPLVTVATSIPTPIASEAPATGLPASGPPQPSPTSTPAAAPVATVAVKLAPAFSALPSAEQILLLGQVVLSLTGAGEQAVAFVDDSGAPVAVPLPDGRLLDVPATARDYNGLIVKP